jgi:sugar O-acyltransferase (sialic acid O-acetyltransferase NeuD family)
MKIFCIGFNKTATTSLSSFFRKNGFFVAPETPFELLLDSYLENNYKNITNFLDANFPTYDFFQDVPFSLPHFYKHLYEKYPDSKFILTVRDNEDDWYQSLLNYHKKIFEDISNPEGIFYLREKWVYDLLVKAYKSPPSNPYDYTYLTQSYLNHNQEVREFFSNKKSQLLEINLNDANVVDKIERFLNVRFENKLMPHLNKSPLKKAIFGNGGHAKEVISYLNEEVTIFVDDQYATESSLPISRFNPKKYEIMVAVSDPISRKKIVESLPEGTQFFSYIHPTSIISGNVDLGEGYFIGPYCILTTNIKIGSHALLNRSVQIGHDCEIGNYLSCMPGVIISGSNKIGDYVYFGAGSVTREKLNITSAVTVGLNSGIIKDIIEPGTYAGTPCKFIKK